MQTASNQLKIAGIVLLIVAAICVFVAIERYQANASAVNAMNELGGGLLQGMAGGELRPSTPTASKYAIALALVCGGGGGYCLWKSKQGTTDGSGEA